MEPDFVASVSGNEEITSTHGNDNHTDRFDRLWDAARALKFNEMTDEEQQAYAAELLGDVENTSVSAVKMSHSHPFTVAHSFLLCFPFCLDAFN